MNNPAFGEVLALLIVSVSLVLMVAEYVRLQSKYEDALQKLARLCYDMRDWSRQEDGIPEEYYADFEAATDLVWGPD